MREYAVLQDQETSDSLLLQTEFTQTFRTGQPFDHVDLWVANWDGGANDSVYDVQVLDEAGRVAAGGELVGAEAPCMEAYSISFERVVPDREQVYRIQVRLKNPDCRIRTDFCITSPGPGTCIRKERSMRRRKSRWWIWHLRCMRKDERADHRIAAAPVKNFQKDRKININYKVAFGIHLC